MKPNIKDFYEAIEIGKSYDSWTFAGFGTLLTVKEDGRNADRDCREAYNKGWAWFLYKDDPNAHPLHRRLIIIEKGFDIERWQKNE